MENRRVVLASRPAGWVTEDNFRIESATVPSPGEGEVLVKNLWLSLDPYMRGRISEAKSYVKGVELGEVMVGQTVGEVLESKNAKFKKGDYVLTQLGWQLYGVSKEITKVEASRAPLSYYLGVLGMPGMTAYFGLKELGQPKAGETVVVSAASCADAGAQNAPAAATIATSMPTASTTTTHPTLFGSLSSRLGIGKSTQTPTAVADTVIIEPARKQNITPLARL